MFIQKTSGRELHYQKKKDADDVRLAPFQIRQLRVFFTTFLFFSLSKIHTSFSRQMPATVQSSITAHVHPLVLLSATDHYNRVAKDTKKRVVGVLLGQNKGKTVNISNSFAGKLQIESNYIFYNASV